MISPKRKAKISKFLRLTKLPYLPSILNIESGNICNLRCPLCPTGAGEPGLKKGFMQFQLFKMVFEQLKDKLRAINLYSWGEPLLNNNLISIINYVKSSNPRIRITTSTNLNVKDKKLLEDLLVSGIDEIIVSCDGSTAQIYEKYRVGGDFTLVMENLKFMLGKKKQIKSNTRIIWNFLVFKHNEQELEMARQLAKEMGVDFRAGLMRTSMKDEILKPHNETIQRDLEWIPDNPLYSAYDKEKLLPKKIIKSCRKPWQEITLNWNGEIFPCCAVYGDKYTFGNATGVLIKDIWNNENYIVCRKEILNKRIRAVTVCGICRDNGFMHM